MSDSSVEKIIVRKIVKYIPVKVGLNKLLALLEILTTW